MCTDQTTNLCSRAWSFFPEVSTRRLWLDLSGGKGASHELLHPFSAAKHALQFGAVAFPLRACGQFVGPQWPFLAGDPCLTSPLSGRAD